MDAYVFTKQATPEAVSHLGAGAGNAGPARVVIPLIGSHALYVAVAAPDAAGLNDQVTQVVGTPGLSGSMTFLASAPSMAPLPTWFGVADFVGFCLVETEPGLALSVYNEAITVPGVIGAAVVTGAGFSVLVEVTAPTTDEVSALLNQVAGLPGVQSAATATGASTLGYGLSRAASAE